MPIRDPGPDRPRARCKGPDLTTSYTLEPRSTNTRRGDHDAVATSHVVSGASAIRMAAPLRPEEATASYFSSVAGGLRAARFLVYDVVRSGPCSVRGGRSGRESPDRIRTSFPDQLSAFAHH